MCVFRFLIQVGQIVIQQSTNWKERPGILIFKIYKLSQKK